MKVTASTDLFYGVDGGTALMLSILCGHKLSGPILKLNQT